MRLRYHVLDVFTDRAFGGNPLAVVFDGEHLDGEVMQRIAAEFNLSETVFVLPPTAPQATHRVRIFTPRAELPFAGHPTVGTAFLLASIGECNLPEVEPVVVLEEGIGNVSVRVFYDGGRIVSTQMSVPRMPERVPAPLAVPELADLLSLTPADFDARIAPQAWSCGMPFLYIALSGVAAARRARLRLDLWARHLQSEPACNVFLLTFETELPDTQIHARMFAPGLGVAEDPATGAAVAALAGLLDGAFPDGPSRWLIEQGIEIGRPSVIALGYQRGARGLQALTVGGPSVHIAEGVLEV